jgi:hypothetical protein
MTPEIQTLSQRLAAGRLPLSDSLRCAMQMADGLRRMHEEGYYHGAVTPDAFLLTRAGVRLEPARPGAIEALTPYTAPERLKGQPPDARTDIFGFGAVLYEMLSGRRAFAGEQPEELAEAIANAAPTPLGDAALDRLVANCLVKDPAGRWQRIQQVQLELKILNFSATRLQAAGSPRPADAALQAELRLVESRLGDRLERQQGVLAGLQHVTEEQSAALQMTSQTVGALQVQLVSLEGQLAATRERAEFAEQAASQTNEGARREAANLQVSLAGELHALELTVKAHGAAIESIRGAMARTDDFMERVVEALESLQTMVLEQAHEPVPADRN